MDNTEAKDPIAFPVPQLVEYLKRDIREDTLDIKGAKTLSPRISPNDFVLNGNPGLAPSNIWNEALVRQVALMLNCTGERLMIKPILFNGILKELNNKWKVIYGSYK